MLPYLYSLLAAFAIAYFAYRAKTLNPSGFLAAVVVGFIIFGMGGWQWAIALLLFFISSSALTKAFKRRKAGLNEKFSKGSQRDAGQVFGNGGLATLFAFLHFLFPAEPLLWYAFIATLAAVNADTWATEIGVLNPDPPRSIIHLDQRVEKGTSGGVSLYGSVGSFLGAALIALSGVLFTPFPSQSPILAFLILSFAGFAGSLFDSFLGATVQAMYLCPACDKETERHPQHSCGQTTRLIRGWGWLNNDLVNFFCSLFSIGFVFFI